MRHRATNAAPSADSATAFSKYFSLQEKEKYERKKVGSEISLEPAGLMRAQSAGLGNLSCPPNAGGLIPNNAFTFQTIVRGTVLEFIEFQKTRS